MSYLRTINRLSGTTNMGGILTIHVARKSEVAAIPDPVDSVIYGAVVFKPGTSWVIWRVTDESASSKSDAKMSREGTAKSNTIPFSVPKYDSHIHRMFEQALDDELIVLYSDANGKKRLFGSLASPVRFTYNYNSGANRSDKHAFQCQFYYDGPENMYAYSGEIPAPPPGTAPAIIKVNGEVLASLQPGETIEFDSDFDFDFAIIGT